VCRRPGRLELKTSRRLNPMTPGHLALVCMDDPDRGHGQPWNHTFHKASMNPHETSMRLHDTVYYMSC